MTTPKPASAPPADAIGDLDALVNALCTSPRDNEAVARLYCATKERLAASAQVREVEALPVCENAQQERGGQDANPVNSANTPFTAGNVDVARQPASSVEYRVVTLGADFEPQMRYQSGVGGVWTWFPLTRDGYWVEPDAYSFGVVTQRSPMPQEEAERAVLRARAINGAHITPANAVKPAPEPAPVAQDLTAFLIYKLHQLAPLGFDQRTVDDAIVHLRTLLNRAEQAEASLAACRADADELSDVLLRNGFVRCDIAACMCGSWHHRYGIRERMNEITDELRDAGVLNNSTGNLPLNAIKKLRKDAERWRWLADEAYSQSADCEADLVALARKLADAHGVESDAIIDAAIDAARSQP